MTVCKSVHAPAATTTTTITTVTRKNPLPSANSYRPALNQLSSASSYQSNRSGFILPLRNPGSLSAAVPSKLQQEARNLAILTSGKTPLLGGESASLEEGAGFGGVVPRQHRITTPSSMVAGGGADGADGVEAGRTPVPGTPSKIGGMAPGRAGRGVAGGTPSRDEVGYYIYIVLYR